MKVNYPETIIEKSTGLNESEEYLNKLCTKTFLSLWSYANLFRDKHKRDTGDGKELCDLLVVFGNHILIFSLKLCEFNQTKDVSTSWIRWYKGAVKESTRQIFGAERWIKNHSDRIFLDKQCTKRFPLNLPNSEDVIIHRIAVAFGATEACKNYFNDRSLGSLKIDTTIRGDMHFTTKNVSPFNVGHVEPDCGYVHVLDDKTLDILMDTLDTAPDFIDYLSKKEALFLQNEIKAMGEEDVLATFLTHINSSNERYFPLDENASNNIVEFRKGNWNDFNNSPERMRQIEANKISYYWDGLIETHNRYFTTGTLGYMSSSDVNETEQSIRIMASENRTIRRLFSESIIELKNKVKNKTNDYKPEYRFSYNPQCKTGYVFMVLEYNEECFESYEFYREYKKNLLNIYLHSMKLRYPDSKWLFGIGIETNIVRGGTSEDFAYLDGSTWTKENESVAIEYERSLIKNGFIRKRTERIVGVDEYPIKSP